MNERKKSNILIVDDRPENILSLEALLDAPDMNIIKAYSGNEALGMILEYDFALVLLDVQMPEMDGFETAELMRSNTRTKHIPIIFVTAINKDQQHVFKGYQAGAVDYIFKPLEPEILKNKVNVFLELHSQKAALKNKNDELRKANQIIHDQQKAAIEEERLKVLLQMAGATAHELNQPLMVLLGNIDLLEMEIAADIPQQLKKILVRIKEAGQRISDTVKKIQTLRRVELKPYANQSQIINFDQDMN